MEMGDDKVEEQVNGDTAKGKVKPAIRRIFFEEITHVISVSILTIQAQFLSRIIQLNRKLMVRKWSGWTRLASKGYSPNPNFRALNFQSPGV